MSKDKMIEEIVEMIMNLCRLGYSLPPRGVVERIATDIMELFGDQQCQNKRS